MEQELHILLRLQSAWGVVPSITRLIVFGLISEIMNAYHIFDWTPSLDSDAEALKGLVDIWKESPFLEYW